MIRFFICDKGFEEVHQWTPGCWVNVEYPDKEDFRFLTEDLGIPELVLEYTADIDERPRIEHDDDWVLTILRVPAKREATVHSLYTIPLGVITKEDVTVTICYHKTEMIDDFINHCRTRSISIENKPTFILRLIFSATYWFLEYLKQINTEVNNAERKLSNSVRNADLMQLMKLQKALVYFNTSLKGNEVLISKLRHVYAENIDLDLLEDVEIELKQAMNTVNIYSEILNGTLDTYASVISNNVNIVMKRMTSVTIVLMIPTLVASFYGMNVDIGLSNNPHAFWIIIALSITLTVIVFFWLRKIKWF